MRSYKSFELIYLKDKNIHTFNAIDKIQVDHIPHHILLPHKILLHYLSFHNCAKQDYN